MKPSPALSRAWTRNQQAAAHFKRRQRAVLLCHGKASRHGPDVPANSKLRSHLAAEAPAHETVPSSVATTG